MNTAARDPLRAFFVPHAVSLIQETKLLNLKSKWIRGALLHLCLGQIFSSKTTNLMNTCSGQELNLDFFHGAISKFNHCHTLSKLFFDGHYGLMEPQSSKPRSHHHHRLTSHLFWRNCFVTELNQNSPAPWFHGSLGLWKRTMVRRVLLRNITNIPYIATNKNIQKLKKTSKPPNFQKHHESSESSHMLSSGSQGRLPTALTEWSRKRTQSRNTSATQSSVRRK